MNGWVSWGMYCDGESNILYNDVTTHWTRRSQSCSHSALQHSTSPSLHCLCPHSHWLHLTNWNVVWLSCPHQQWWGWFSSYVCNVLPKHSLSLFINSSTNALTSLQLTLLLIWTEGEEWSHQLWRMVIYCGISFRVGSVDGLSSCDDAVCTSVRRVHSTRRTTIGKGRRGQITPIN